MRIVWTEGNIAAVKYGKSMSERIFQYELGKKSINVRIAEENEE